MCFPIPAKCATFNLATFFNFFLKLQTVYCPKISWVKRRDILCSCHETLIGCSLSACVWTVFCRHFLFLREWASNLFFKFAYFVCGAEDAQKTLLTDVIVPSCSTNRFQRSSFVRAWDLETEPTRGPPQTKTGRSQPDQSWNLFARFLEFCAFSSLC